MARLRRNFLSGTITNNPLAIGGTTLNSAALANLPAVVGPDVMPLVLDPLAVNGTPEVVYVTAHTASATSATITRGQETSVGGFAAREHPTGTQWVHGPTVLDADPTPYGAVMMTAASAAPSGYLLCDGASVATATYPDLFAAIGYTYGGSGGNFNVPNLKGRVPVGRDSADADFDTLGETRGAKTHALSIAELASHGHTQDAHSHSHGHGFAAEAPQTGVEDTAHSHSTSKVLTNLGSGHAHDNNNNEGAASPTGGGSSFGTALVSTTQSANHTHWLANHGHSFNSDATGATATNQTTGSGTAHNNIQPSIVLNYIIRAL